MVINEKGLIRAMKEAYKSEGYEIQCKRIGDVKEIHLETTTWRVTCVLKNLPRKVLGLIVEHLGEIPETGQALQVKKGTPQTKIFSEDTEAFCGLTPDDSVNPAIAHKTAIVYRYGNIWKQTRGNKVLWINPELEEIMLMNRPVMCLGEKVLSISGLVSGVYIKPSSPQKAEDRQILDYLAGIQIYD